MSILTLLDRTADNHWLAVDGPTGEVMKANSESLPFDQPERISTDLAEGNPTAEALRFQAGLLDAIDQAIIVMKLDGTVRHWNRSAERLYGWTSGEALGQALGRLQVTDSPLYDSNGELDWHRGRFVRSD
jgi:PAS domain-containing protein